jgi:cell division protease FtsH
MLVKPPKNTESKPASRFLQFFGLENSRESESAKAKNRATKEPEERKHQFATFSQLFWAGC